MFSKGIYKYLEIELKSSQCQLIDFSGNSLINTYSGAIEVDTTNAVITAFTRNGKVKIPGVPQENLKLISFYYRRYTGAGKLNNISIFDPR